MVTFPTKEAKFLRHRPYHLRCLITADVVEKLRQTGYQYVVSNSILRELKLQNLFRKVQMEFEIHVIPVEFP